MTGWATLSAAATVLEMTRDELERAVASLGAGYRALLLAGDVAGAREIALDKWLCVSVLRRYE